MNTLQPFKIYSPYEPIDSDVEEEELGPGWKELESGIIVPEHVKKYPTCFDFFAGAGGFSCGVVQAGFQVVGALEWDCAASWTYMTNLGAYPIKITYSSDPYKRKLEQYFEKAYKKAEKRLKKNKIVEAGDLIGQSGDGWLKSEREAGTYYPACPNFFFGDITELTGAQILKVLGMKKGELDLVIGGPPCQGFSRANSKNSPKNEIKDPRNNLVFEYARMIVELQPKTFCMENVPDIILYRDSYGVPILDRFLHIIEEGDYMSYEAGLRALNITREQMGIKKQLVVRTSKSTDPRHIKDQMKGRKKKLKKKKVKAKKAPQLPLFQSYQLPPQP